MVAAKKNPGGSNQDILSALNYVESTVIKTDFNYVDKANELIMEINKFHQDSSTALSFVSKSSLLPQENTMLNAIAKVLSNLQISCVAEIKNILYAGSAYESLDKALALDAEKFSNVLNENIQSYKVPMVTLNDTDASNLNNVKLYTTSDLMNKSVYDRANLTADEINMIIESELKGRESVLSGTGKYWIEASNKTGLDPLFLLALARQESGLGTSKYAINYNNFFGLKYQNGVQYFGKNRNGVYVEQMYADNPGEGIIKGSEWIKECYVEQCGGNTTRKFGNTGYNGGYNYGTVLSSIMGRMGNTYQSVTGNPISFIDASSSGNYVMSTISSTEYTIPSQVSNSTQTINSVYAPMSSSSINYSANSTSSNTQTFSSTQSSQPISGFVQNSQPVSGSVQSSQPIPENINAGTMMPFNKPDVTSETEMVSESNVIPNSNITSSLDSTTSPDIAPETETILKPTEEIETETIVSPNSTVKPETSTKSDSIPENNTDNNTNNNPILSSVGIIAGVGAVAAASVYGAKKIKDKTDENNEV